MESTSHLQMMGCLGKHGPYTFYKSIKIGDRVLSLATFMPVKIWPDMEFLSIADIQLIWSDKNNESLCSLRLYFLPENTPDGRMNQHGEDEVVALRDRVVVKASDLSSWLVPDSDWKWGLKAPSTVSNKSIHTRLSKSFVSGDEKYKINSEEGVNSIVVLSYSRYIRLRTVLKRLEGTPEINDWLANPAVLAIGGLNIGPNSRILYTKEVIEVPELEFHELLCNHLAPKRITKGKRRKKKVRNLSQGSNSTTSDSMSVESDESERTKRANGILTPPLPKAVDIKPFVPSASKRTPQTSHDQVAFNLSKTVQDILSAFSTNGGLEISKVDPRAWGHTGDITVSRKRLGSNGGAVGADNVEDLQRLLGKLVSANQDLENPYGLCDPKLGSSLEELAAKLRKSNALQISPIRPSVIRQQDNMGDGEADNHIGIKRIKTEDNGQDNLTSARARDFGSSSVGSNRTSSPKSSRNKFGARHDMRSVSPNQASKKIRSQSDQAAIIAQLPVMHLPGTSPSPFASTKKIYGDPYEYKKQNMPGHYSKTLVVDVDNIVDLASSKRNSASKKTPYRPSVNQASKFEKPSGLLDRCSTQPVSSNQGMFHGITGIPPPNAMNQHGLQLTSEVTLYPSQTPSSAKPKSSSSSTRIGNNSHSSTKSHATVQNPHITIQQSSRSSRPSTSTPTTSSGPPPMSLPFGTDMNALQAFMQSAGNSNGALHASHAALAMAGLLERPEGEAAVTINPYFAPSLYGKMDPNMYLSLLGSNMYPSVASGLMMMPGAMEQLYKDLMEQERQRNANLSNLPPGNWFLPHGKDRGNKS